jgi:hypothetical protein
MGSGLATLAAVLFALGTVLPQMGTMTTEDGDTRFLLHILRRPVWLAGVGGPRISVAGRGCVRR